MALFKPVIDTVGRRKNAYCGPTAISILTGVPVSRIESMLRRCRRGGYRNAKGRKIPIRATYTWEVVSVLKRLGCRVEEFSVTVPVLSQFVDDVRHVGTFLVNVTSHFMVCFGGHVADGNVPDGVAIENYHRGTRRVVRAWKVVAPLLPKYGPDDGPLVARAPKPKKDIRAVRAEKVVAAVKKWERREKLAKTKLKKLRSQLRRYQKLGLLAAGEVPQ